MLKQYLGYILLKLKYTSFKYTLYMYLLVYLIDILKLILKLHVQMYIEYTM